MIRAIIFDMDGVIADSEPLHEKTEKEVMLSYGIKISSNELSQYTGTTAKFMFSDLIKKYKLPTTLEKILKEKEKIYLKLIKAKLKPIQGVIDFIFEVKKKNLKIALASSSRRKFIDIILAKFGILNLFDAIISAENIKNSKPDPKIFLKAAKAIRINTENCLVIEDSKWGVEGAKSAGMRCIGFKSPPSGNQDLSKADLVISSFKKIGHNKPIGLVSKILTSALH